MAIQWERGGCKGEKWQNRNSLRREGDSNSRKAISLKGVVFLKDQYKGLKEAEGMIYPKPIAIKVSSLEVEKRSLGVYQSLLEVDRI